MRAIAEQEPLLIFRVGGVTCCAPVRDVDSIVIPQPMNSFPGQSADIAGVFQYRSHTVSVVKLHTKFGLPDIKDKTRGRIIMAYTHHTTNGLTGFWVDEIEEITSGYEADFSTPPKFIGGNVFDRTLIWKDKMVLHTDFDKLYAMKDSAPLSDWMQVHSMEMGTNDEEPTDGSGEIVTLQSDKNKLVESTSEQVEEVSEASLNNLLVEKDGDETSVLDDIPDEEVVSSDAANLDGNDTNEEQNNTEFENNESLELEDVQQDNDAESEPVSETSEDSTALSEIGAATGDEAVEEISSDDLYNDAMLAMEDATVPLEELDEAEEESEIAVLTESVDVDLAAHEIEQDDVPEEIESSEIVEELEEITSPQIEPFSNEIVHPAPEILIPEPSAEEHSYIVDATPSTLQRNEEASPRGMIIAGVSALVLVAAVGGYLIFSDGSESQRTEGQPVIESTSAPAEITELETLEVPTQRSLATLEETVAVEDTQSVADPDIVKEFKASLDSATESASAIEVDKPKELIPIEPVVSQPKPPLKPVEPQLPVWGVHKVTNGDTLWHLADKYLNNPFRFVDLARWSDIKNPDRIYPGDNVKYKRNSD